MDFIDLKTQQNAIKPELDRRIAKVFEHGQYIMGPEVAELEGTLADYVGVKHCVTVASGTEALLISLMALGIGPGDEVITTPFSFIATAEVIALLGATPVFVDVNPQTANLDDRLIEEKITNKTKAIMPVSLYGQVADFNRINAIAAAHGNIPVIEDGAQSFGATWEGKRSCGLSTIGCTSFFPSKPLGCYGDGGALFTDDDDIARACREIRVHGQSKRYVHTRIGLGGRMDTLQCAVALAKWPRFEWEVARRNAIGAEYTRRLLAEVPNAQPLDPKEAGDDLKGLRTLALLHGSRSVYAQYTVLIPNRERVQAELHNAGIPTAVHYPTPINAQTAYMDRGKNGTTPMADWLAKHVMSLPMGPDLQQSDLQYIAKILTDIFESQQ